MTLRSSLRTLESDELLSKKVRNIVDLKLPKTSREASGKGDLEYCSDKPPNPLKEPDPLPGGKEPDKLPPPARGDNKGKDAPEVKLKGVNAKNRDQVLKAMKDLEAKLAEIDDEYCSKINDYCFDKVLGDGEFKKLDEALKAGIKGLDTALEKAGASFKVFKEFDELAKKMCKSAESSKDKLEKNKEVLDKFVADMNALRKKIGEPEDFKLPPDAFKFGLSPEDFLAYAKEHKIAAARNVKMNASFVELCLYGDISTNGDKLVLSSKVPPGIKSWLEKHPKTAADCKAAIEKYGPDFYPLLYDVYAAHGHFGGIGKDFKIEDGVPPGLKAWVEKKKEDKDKTEYRDQRLKELGLDIEKGTFEGEESVKKRMAEAQKTAEGKTIKTLKEKMTPIFAKDFPGYDKAEAVYSAYLTFSDANKKFMDGDKHVALKVKELGKGWLGGEDAKLKTLFTQYRDKRAAAIAVAIANIKKAGATVSEEALKSYKDILSSGLYPGLD